MQNTIERIEHFHRINELLQKRGLPTAVPVVKARLVEQNEFHKQALEENDPWERRASLSSVASTAVKNT
jgi:hypothetical protein